MHHHGSWKVPGLQAVLKLLNTVPSLRKLEMTPSEIDVRYIPSVKEMQDTAKELPAIEKALSARSRTHQVDHAPEWIWDHDPCRCVELKQGVQDAEEKYEKYRWGVLLTAVLVTSCCWCVLGGPGKGPNMRSSQVAQGAASVYRDEMPASTLWNAFMMPVSTFTMQTRTR